MAVFSGKWGSVRDLDLIGDAFVANRFGVGEVVGKQIDVGLARRDQDAIASRPMPPARPEMPTNLPPARGGAG